MSRAEDWWVCLEEVDQRWFIGRITVVIAGRFHVTEDTLDGPPFAQHGSAEGFCQAYGDERAAALRAAELRKELPA